MRRAFACIVGIALIAFGIRIALIVGRERSIGMQTENA
jgi:hypothetical protein